MKAPIVQSAGMTDIGLKREGNEDAYFLDDELGLYVVADGMGGHLAGEVASRVAVDLINKNYKDLKQTQTPMEALFGYPDDSLSLTGNYVLSSIRLANRVIYEMATQYEEYHGMGTTVAALAVTPRRIITANVGDSRIYVIRKGEIDKMSEDHTMVAKQVEMGIMTNEEAENSPMKHMLTRNLGSAEYVDPEIFEADGRPGSRYILCTDGLTDLVSEREILEIVQEQETPEVTCSSLINKALSRGGHDNTTVVSVFVTGGKKSSRRRRRKP
jgi:protein phosphatase